MKSFGVAALAALAAVMPTIAQTPSGFSPSTNQTFSVKFGNIAVLPGSSISLQDTQISPAIEFSSPSNDTAHVVAMLDLDAPMGDANRTFSPLLHWMTLVPSDVQSLPSNDSSIHPVAAYVGPAPPPGYGAHRYVLLVLADHSNEFELPPGFEGETYADIESRVMFGIDGFIEAGGFTLTAANWFTTENHTTVAEQSGAEVFAPMLRMGGVGLLSALATLLL